MAKPALTLDEIARKADDLGWPGTLYVENKLYCRLLYALGTDSRVDTLNNFIRCGPTLVRPAGSNDAPDVGADEFYEPW